MTDVAPQKLQTAEDAEDAEEMKVDEITGIVVDAAIKIHSALGARAAGERLRNVSEARAL